MDKNINIQPAIQSDLTNETEILTLKNIFYFLKRSAIRLFLYCLVAIIIASAIYIILKLIKVNGKSGTAYAQIQFNYSGIENGLNPYGQKFDVEFVKSPYVVNKAIENLGLDYDVNLVRDNLHINAVIPPEIAEQIFYNKQIISNEIENLDKIKPVAFNPTDFIIELSDFASNEKAAKSLLAEIIKQAKEIFISNYNTLLIYNFSFLDKATMEKYDFVTQSEILETELYQLESYFNNTLHNHMDFKSVSTGQTIRELSIKANLLRQYDLSQIDDCISADIVTKFTYGTMAKLIKEQEKKYNNELNILTKKEKVLQDAIIAYGKEETVIIPSSTDGSLLEINRPTAYYESLFRDLILVNNDIAYYEEKLSALSDKYLIVSQFPINQTSSQDDTDNINAMFDRLLDDYNILIQETNLTISVFLESEYEADIIKTTIAPIYSLFARDFNGNLFYYIFIALVLGSLAAFVETGIRVYLEKKKIV